MQIIVTAALKSADPARKIAEMYRRQSDIHLAVIKLHPVPKGTMK